MTARGYRLALAALVVWSLAACGWFATVSPNSKRFWDERYSVDNVKKLLVEGTLRPDNGWYGRLSYLPQAAALAGAEALDRLAGTERFELVRGNGDFAEPAYVVSRLVSALYGAAALIVTFAVGRRVFSPETALLGAVLLASSPWVLRHFVTFKPDALLVLLILVACAWSLEAAERPSYGSFAVAGAGVGLAASAKFIGALAALPVVAAALVVGGGWTTALRRLVVAGATAVAVFLALHPDLGFYAHYFGQQREFYAKQGSHDFGSMLGGELSSLLHPSFHGPWIGALTLAGLAVLTVRLFRLLRVEAASTRARNLAVLLSFPLGFSLVYALATTWPKGNNYLAIVPFTSLAAAWLLVTLWRWTAPRLPRAVRRPVLGVALAGVLLAELWPANVHIYAQTVPTTLDLVAERILEASPLPSLRRAIVERVADRPFEAGKGRSHRRDVVMTREVRALSELPQADLDLADFEIFPEARLGGGDGEVYRRRIERLDHRAVVLVRPRWFRSRGPAWVLLMHPWSVLGQPVPIGPERRAAGEGRRLRAGEIVSIEARVPRKEGQSLTGVVVGGVELPLIWNGWDSRDHRFATWRFVVPGPNLRVRPMPPGRRGSDDPARLFVVRWRAGTQPAVGSTPSGGRSDAD